MESDFHSSLLFSGGTNNFLQLPSCVLHFPTAPAAANMPPATRQGSSGRRCPLPPLTGFGGDPLLSELGAAQFLHEPLHWRIVPDLACKRRFLQWNYSRRNEGKVAAPQQSSFATSPRAQLGQSTLCWEMWAEGGCRSPLSRIIHSHVQTVTFCPEEKYYGKCSSFLGIA